MHGGQEPGGFKITLNPRRTYSILFQTPPEPMLSPEKKAAMIREQVVSKIHWGTTDDEVLNWLHGQHGISGVDADRMLKEAHRAKRGAVRGKAFMTLIFSGLGMLIPLGFIGLQISSGVFIISTGSMVILGAGIICLGIFLRSLLLLVTGRREGAAD